MFSCKNVILNLFQDLTVSGFINANVKNQGSGSKNEALLNDNSLASLPLCLSASKLAPTQPSLIREGKKAAFTLAEVLITLGIIGVVAAMTLPTLIQKYQEKATVVKLKKMYSVLSQAYNMYLQDNEPEWFDPKTEEGAISAFNVFKPSLKILKDCGVDDYSCIYQGRYLRKNGILHGSYADEALDTRYYKVLLADGSSLLFRGGSRNFTSGYEYDYSDNYNIDILYDINGPKPPNKWGEDMFDFLVHNRTLYPSGQLKFITSPEEYDNYCLKVNSEGFGCAAWVIFQENMDYLHCDDLSWTGKTKCK